MTVEVLIISWSTYVLKWLTFITPSLKVKHSANEICCHPVEKFWYFTEQSPFCNLQFCATAMLPDKSRWYIVDWSWSSSDVRTWSLSIVMSFFTPYVQPSVKTIKSSKLSDKSVGLSARNQLAISRIIILKNITHFNLLSISRSGLLVLDRTWNGYALAR